jgi:hypothetical protein
MRFAGANAVDRFSAGRAPRVNDRFAGPASHWSAKEQIERNTRQFVQGAPANNVLLTGARGTGKSSLIKACLTEFAAQGLRLIEVDKAIWLTYRISLNWSPHVMNVSLFSVMICRSRKVRRVTRR